MRKKIDTKILKLYKIEFMWANKVPDHVELYQDLQRNYCQL